MKFCVFSEQYFFTHSEFVSVRISSVFMTLPAPDQSAFYDPGGHDHTSKGNRHPARPAWFGMTLNAKCYKTKRGGIF
jgi:hypothetical protein